MELEKAKELNYKEILQNEEVKAYLEKGNENLGILGYTDHSEKHCACDQSKESWGIWGNSGMFNLGKVENAAERQNPCYVSDWKS